MHADALPFCQRNVRLWLAVLGVCSVAVLAYSIWLAASRSGPHVSHARGPAAMPAAAPIAYPGVVSYPAAPRSPESLTWVARPPAAVAPAADLQSSFRQVADRIRPAVVSINAMRIPAPRPDGIPDALNRNLPYESVGSGLIVDPAGYVVTNNHLVSEAQRFLVTRFQRGNERLPARLVAADPELDLALLKIDAPGPFATAEFADSSKVEVGDWVLAVGNPFGFGHTVTAGIISGRRASISIGGVQYQGLLQTDAPINQGSSGGPLCNLAAQVVGINTAIYAPTGVFNGTGFAIPSNRVTAFIAARLQAPGTFAAAAIPVAAVAPMPGAAGLGAGVLDLTPDLAAKLALPGGSGAFVSSVTADSPADAAELTRGDVITSVAGQPVAGAEGLRSLLGQLQPGQAVPFTVWRQGVERSLTVRVPGPGQ